MLETLRLSVRSFSSHGGRVLGAATALYALLAIAPMLLMGIVVAGVVSDRAEARAEIAEELALWLGPGGAQAIGEILDRLDESGRGPLAGVLSAAVLTWASMRLFSQLRYSLNHLWGVRELSGRGFSTRALRQARRRASALLMVTLVVLTIALTVLGKALLSAAAQRLGADLSTRWHVVEFAVSFFVLTLLSTAVFKVLPAVRIGWRDALTGAVVTALLFSVGATAIGWYLGWKGTSSAYGAAGSLVAVLLWIYYSAQAFFLGAAFTRTYAERHGGGLELVEGAVRIVEADSAPDLAGDELL